MAEKQPLDQLTNHAYDGIQEYDNPLPGWWKFLFWASFFFSVAYLFYDSARPEFGYVPEYESEMQTFWDAEAERTKNDPITEFGLVQVMQNKSAMAQAATIFEKSCKLCHKADATGDIGPNLTDEYWIHGNKLVEIYSVIKDGRNKMPPWGKKLRPDVLKKMAGFVGTLRGKNRPGKAPQGNKLPPAPIPDKPDAPAAPAAEAGAPGA